MTPYYYYNTQNTFIIGFSKYLNKSIIPQKKDFKILKFLYSQVMFLRLSLLLRSVNILILWLIEFRGRKCRSEVNKLINSSSKKGTLSRKVRHVCGLLSRYILGRCFIIVVK